MSDNTNEFLTALEQYKAATLKLQETWETLKDTDAEAATDAEQEYPFMEDLDEVAEQVVLWVDHQVELMEKKQEWT